MFSYCFRIKSGKLDKLFIYFYLFCSYELYFNFQSVLLKVQKKCIIYYIDEYQKQKNLNTKKNAIRKKIWIFNLLDFDRSLVLNPRHSWVEYFLQNHPLINRNSNKIFNLNF